MGQPALAMAGWPTSLASSAAARRVSNVKHSDQSHIRVSPVRGLVAALGCLRLDGFRFFDRMILGSYAESAPISLTGTKPPSSGSLPYVFSRTPLG